MRLGGNPVERLGNLRSALGWAFILSTIVLVLCRLWLNYYEGRPLPIGPGDRDLTLAVYQVCAVIAVGSLAGFSIVIFTSIFKRERPRGRDSEGSRYEWTRVM